MGQELGSGAEMGRLVLEEICRLLEEGELARVAEEVLDVVREWIHVENVLQYLRKYPLFPPEE